MEPRRAGRGRVGEPDVVDSIAAAAAVARAGAEHYPQEEIVAEIRTYAADGEVAYSSICMHQGCDVSQRKHDTGSSPRDCPGALTGPAEAAGGAAVIILPFAGRPVLKDMRGGHPRASM